MTLANKNNNNCLKKKGNLGRKKKLPQLKELEATEIIKKKN